jgi:hypothetical protein
MIYLILLALSIVLFVGFFALTVVEAQTGRRMFGLSRKKFDKNVGRVFFIIEHVDWSGFIAHLVQSVAARVAHDIAHWTLMTVRFLERQLTTVVRTLRNQRPNLLAPKPSRTSPLTQVSGYLQATIRRNRESRKKKRQEIEEQNDRV